MSGSFHRPIALCGLPAAIIALLALAGCWLAATPPPATVATLPTRAATSAAPAGALTPTPMTPLTPTTETGATTPIEQAAAVATPTAASVGLVYSDENGVSWADLTTGEVLPLVADAATSGWALQGQRLATARERHVELIALHTGQVTLLDTGIAATPAEAQVLWSNTDEGLLYAGWVEPDPEAEEPRQELLLCELAADGAVAAPATYSGPPAMLLGYDGAAHRALLWSPGPDGTGLQVLTVDPRSGQPESTVLLAGLGELALGPQGALAWLAARKDGGYALMTGALATAAAPQALALEAGTYAVQPTWSPDGRRVAFLLRRGALYDPEAEDLGLYVLDVASGQASGPLADSLPYASISGWTPDGERIILRNQSNDARYYATIGLDGSQELLPLKGTATLLGWLERPTLAADAATLDAWRSRFAAAAGDAEATAAAAASYLVANPDVAVEQRAAQLRSYYAGAGWPDREWKLIELEPELFVMQAPPASIVLATAETGLIVGQGDTLQEARSAHDRIAVIYGGQIGSSSQWSVTLLQKQEAGWQIVWQPSGRNDWLTTNGAVAFEGKGIDTLQVAGTSLGLPADVFLECADCPLRQFKATWERDENAYVRATTLAADAPLAAVHWELTARTPYALLYETVRRWRAGEPCDDLIDSQAEEQLADLGLADADLRLLVASATEESVIFGPADAPASLEATIARGRIVAIGPH